MSNESPALLAERNGGRVCEGLSLCPQGRSWPTAWITHAALTWTEVTKHGSQAHCVPSPPKAELWLFWDEMHESNLSSVSWVSLIHTINQEGDSRDRSVGAAASGSSQPTRNRVLVEVLGMLKFLSKPWVLSSPLGMFWIYLPIYLFNHHNGDISFIIFFSWVLFPNFLGYSSYLLFLCPAEVNNDKSVRAPL